MKLNKFKLTLYVTGRTIRSETAINNLTQILSDFEDQYELTIVDILENPQLAENEKILATPTLIKKLPHPIRQIIGDLSDSEKVLLGLNIQKIPNSKDAKGGAL